MRRFAASASLVLVAAVTTAGCLMVGGPHHGPFRHPGHGWGFGKWLILGLQVLAVVEILRRTDLPKDKQAIWALVVLLLPVFGLIAYAIWGRGSRCCARRVASESQA